MLIGIRGGIVVKVLGVNGSPRKYGETFKLLMLALEAAREEGAETELINLYDMDIKPCIGCLSDNQLACRYPCIYEDDMKKLYDKILKANALIIATPIYWFSVSGVLKNFIDRLTVFENMIYITGRSWVEGKVAGFIAVGNDSGAIQVIANLMAILNAMGFIIPPWAMAYFNARGNVLEDEGSVMDALNVGRIVTITARIVEEVKEWYKMYSKEQVNKYKQLIAKITTDNRDKYFPMREKFYARLLTRTYRSQH